MSVSLGLSGLPISKEGTQRVARGPSRLPWQRRQSEMNAVSGALRWLGPQWGGRWTVLAKPWQVGADPAVAVEDDEAVSGQRS